MKLRRARRRVAISELLGTLIMVAVTLTAGAAVFGWVLGETGSSTNSIGNHVATNVNFLNEREVVVNAALAGTNATLWVYNNGALNPESIVAVLSYNTASPSAVCNSSTVTSLRVASIDPPKAVTVNTQNIVPVSVSVASCTKFNSFTAGDSYTFIVVGEYGSTAQITVKF